MRSHELLNLAQTYASIMSGCKKVAVGCVITSARDQIVAFGANRAMPDLCKARECMRIEKYGEDSKNHRLPSDCRAIHSEVDAICSAARTGISLALGTAYVTRYPCESCAKALITADIKKVIYGGTAEISEQTRDLFERYGVECIHVKDWKEDLSDR